MQPPLKLSVDETIFNEIPFTGGLFLLASCSQAPKCDPVLPDADTRAEFTNAQEGPFRLEFYDLPSPVYPSQRITFRVYYNELHSYGYGEHQFVNVRVYNPETGKDSP